MKLEGGLRCRDARRGYACRSAGSGLENNGVCLSLGISKIRSMEAVDLD
jgi:hypothetical protein